MTEELFREDAYLRECSATVIAVSSDGIELDRTVFYPLGGGQPGDSGVLRLADGREVAIADTRKGAAPGAIAHIPADGADLPAVGDRVTATIDWDRRYRHMRVHTGMHLLCAVVEGDVTGGQIGDGKGRIDFNLPTTDLDKEAIGAEMNRLIADDHPVGTEWISDEEMAERPDLVRTMSVKPPMGQGRVRLLRIGDGVDLQPCGGTHVRKTSEIGRIRMGKIENKGRQNRRVTFHLEE